MPGKDESHIPEHARHPWKCEVCGMVVPLPEPVGAVVYNVNRAMMWCRKCGKETGHTPLDRG